MGGIVVKGSSSSSSSKPTASSVFGVGVPVQSSAKSPTGVVDRYGQPVYPSYFGGGGGGVSSTPTAVSAPKPTGGINVVNKQAQQKIIEQQRITAERNANIKRAGAEWVQKQEQAAKLNVLTDIMRGSPEQKSYRLKALGMNEQEAKDILMPKQEQVIISQNNMQKVLTASETKPVKLSATSLYEKAKQERQQIETRKLKGEISPIEYQLGTAGTHAGEFIFGTTATVVKAGKFAGVQAKEFIKEPIQKSVSTYKSTTAFGKNVFERTINGELPKEAISFVREGGKSAVATISERPAVAAIDVGLTIASGKLINEGVKATSSIIGKTTQELPFINKPYQVTPTKEMIKEVKPFSRQRATLILKSPEGKYILGETKSGQVISIGGGIEKGQTAKQAVLAELKQETGLLKSDLVGLKYEREFVTPEETFYTYTARLKQGVRINPSSDIKKIVEFKPTILTKTTGASFRHPLERKGIRSYEAGIINFLETGKEPTWLMLKSNLGEFYLGTQSRYNVPSKQQLKYFNEKDLLVAHGTPEPKLVRRFYPTFKEMEISGEKSKRGVKGLYFQPPISEKGFYPEIKKLIGYTGKGETIFSKEIKELPIKVNRQQKGYVGLSYTGIVNTEGESLGLKIGRPKPTIYIGKESPSKFIATPKVLAGKESELLVEPTEKSLLIPRSVGTARIQYIGGKRVRVQEIKLVDLRNFDKEITKASTLKEQIKFLKKETGIDYGKYTYIRPETIGVTSGLKLRKKESFEKESLRNSEIKLNKSFYEPVLVKEKNISYPSGREVSKSYGYSNIVKELTRGIKEPIIRVNKRPKYIYKTRGTYRYKPYKEKLVPEKPFYITERNSGFKGFGELLKGEGKGKLDLGMEGFDVYKISKGKPKRVARGLGRRSALDIGTREVLKDLGATFFLKKSDISARDITTGNEFARFRSLFREPTKKSRLRKYADFDIFVQKEKRTPIGTGRLTFFGEKEAIQKSRMNKIMNSIK